MKTAPLVSAIIIFLNGEKYLSEAVESVLAQTYTNWELLLVDDGSTDASRQISLEYVRTYSGRVKYLHHRGNENRGMSATRNLGIQHAKGEYIGFLDADDVWLPNKLSEQVEIFNHHSECAMVYGRTQIWHSWTGRQDDLDSDYFLPLGVKANSLVFPPNIALLILENRVQSPTTCNVLLKKVVFDKAGLFVENFKGMFEDAAFFCKASLYFSTYVSDAYWARYRQHDESCSSSSLEQAKDVIARQKFLTWFLAYLNTEQLVLPRLRIVLYKEMLFLRNKAIRYLFTDPVKHIKNFLFRTLPKFTK